MKDGIHNIETYEVEYSKRIGGLPEWLVRPLGQGRTLQDALDVASDLMSNGCVDVKIRKWTTTSTPEIVWRSDWRSDSDGSQDA